MYKSFRKFEQEIIVSKSATNIARYIRTFTRSENVDNFSVRAVTISETDLLIELSIETVSAIRFINFRYEGSNYLLTHKLFVWLVNNYD